PLAARRAGAWLALPLLAGGCWALYRAGHAPLPLLLVPVAFIGLVAWMFGRTLRPGRLPLITRLVTILYDTPVECLEPEVLRYARGVTLGWTLLLLVLGAVNLLLAMIATPDGLMAQLGLQPPVAITRTQWSWFANLFNYGIIAAFFVSEFQLRKLRFPGRHGLPVNQHVEPIPARSMFPRLGWSVLNLVQFAFTLAWTMACITVALLVWAVTGGRRHLPLRMASWLWAPGLLGGAGARVQVEGQERVDWSKPYVVVANHQSVIDICALFRAVPVPLHFLLKQEMQRVPFVN